MGRFGADLTFLRPFSASRLLDEIREDTDELAHYAVSPITKKMAKGLFLPPFARCGGGTSEKVKMNLWMSGGGTRSVLHSDPYDSKSPPFPPSAFRLLFTPSFPPPPLSPPIRQGPRSFLRPMYVHSCCWAFAGG